MDGKVIDALLGLLDQRVAEDLPCQVLGDAADLLERLVDGDGADGDGRIAHDPFARRVDVVAGREVHHRVGAPADRPNHLFDLFSDRRGDRGIADVSVDLNQEINWIPSNVRDGRFGKWLEGARDWSISRNRFWGSPVTVWKSDNPEYPRIDVYGSLDELERDFGVRPDNLHRPFIDDLVRANPDDPSGKSMMRRVPEVLDCWFESGSMPFAQVHYPFENKDWFEDHFPADFIGEYINQTRGWFYTLHVLAGALFEKPAFKNVICHGILLADDGAKLSKKLRNYTEPSEIFETQGSDALRWYFMSSNIVRGGDSRISDQGIDDVVRQIITPIWNAYSFFTLYANIDNYKADWKVDSSNVLDQYILSKTDGSKIVMDGFISDDEKSISYKKPRNDLLKILNKSNFAKNIFYNIADKGFRF